MTNLSFLEFFAKYNGKLVDVDCYPKDQMFQCVDLARLYVREVYGLPVGTLAPGNAIDIYLKAPNIAGGQYFQKIPNYPWTVPIQGDLAVWKAPFGSYVEKGVKKYAGHIAAVNEGDRRRFSSMDQNWSMTGKPDEIRCRLVEHTYSGVVGFLRFKGKTS